MTQPQSFETNVAKAEGYLARSAQEGVQHFIDGEPRLAASGRTFETRTPIDDRVLAQVAAGDSADVDAAARAAERAFPAWRDLPGSDRRALLHKIADAIEARAEEIALLESLDTGQAIRFMSVAAKRGAENFRFFADKAPEANFMRRISGPSTTRCGRRLGRSLPSRRGTRRSCCRRGRLRRHSRPAALWCTSRRSGAR